MESTKLGDRVATGWLNEIGGNGLGMRMAGWWGNCFLKETMTGGKWECCCRWILISRIGVYFGLLPVGRAEDFSFIWLKMDVLGAEHAKVDSLFSQLNVWFSCNRILWTEGTLEPRGPEKRNWHLEIDDFLSVKRSRPRIIINIFWCQVQTIVMVVDE